MPSDPDTLVVVASNLPPEDAVALRGALESAGMVAVTWEDSAATLEGGIVAANVNVAVRAADAPRAREIVAAAADGESRPLVRSGSRAIPRAVVAVAVALLAAGVVARCLAG